jgi:hypothetical protein
MLVGLLGRLMVLEALNVGLTGHSYHGDVVDGSVVHA